MVGLTRIKENIRKKIEEDIKTNFGNEPLGDSIYLFFLTKNNIDSSGVENLIDWMKTWVRNILHEWNLTRFLDKEITSAILGYYSLNKLGIELSEINIEEINEKLAKFIRNNYFFDNPTYTSIILFSLVEQRDKIKQFNNMLEGIKKLIYQDNFYNDAKRLIFISLLMEQTKNQKDLKYIVDFCFEKINKHSLRAIDKIYYAWILWKYRELKTGKDISIILDFVKNVLENTPAIIELDEFSEKEIVNYYGYSNGPVISKILLSVVFDLIVDYENKTSILMPGWWYIKQRLDILGWKEILKELELAWSSFENNRTSDCCNNLRMSLIITLTKIYEKLERNKPSISPGKTPNPTELTKIFIKYGMKDDIRGLIHTIWSCTSERAHVEKRDGKQPSESETRMTFQMTFSILEYLLRFLDEINNS